MSSVNDAYSHINEDFSKSSLAKKILINTDLVAFNLPPIYATLEFLSICLVSYFVPFMLGHPQFLVGTLVNACLFYGGLNMDLKKLIPIITLPSLAVLSKGMIFGTMTVKLAYFILPIWISNALLAIMFKRLKLRSKISFIKSIFLSALTKSIFLFGFATLFYQLKLVPLPFLVLMGPFQFATAFAGGNLAWASQTIRSKLFQHQ